MNGEVRAEVVKSYNHDKDLHYYSLYVIEGSSRVSIFTSHNPIKVLSKLLDILEGRVSIK
jgi:hypothetical protein